MQTSDAVWAAIITAGAAYEAYALRSRTKGDTLSELTRKAFLVHTRAGAWTFGVAWTAFSGWFLGHILWDWPFPGF